MPAQPPFFTPTRTAVIGRSALAMTALIRSAAASVSRITWGLGRATAIFISSARLIAASIERFVANYVMRGLCSRNSPHIQYGPGLVRHAARVPRRIPHDIHLGFTHARDTYHRVFHLGW